MSIDSNVAYLFPTEALVRERLTALMQGYGADTVGRFAVPFHPQGVACDLSRCGEPPSLEFGCVAAGGALAKLVDWPDRPPGSSLYYEVIPDARCPHRLWLCVPNTIAGLLNPLVDLMRLSDDHADSELFAEMLNDRLLEILADVPECDETSRIQLRAIGVPEERLDDHLAHLASIARKVWGRDDGMRWAEWGYPGEMTWGPGRPLRVIKEWGSHLGKARFDSALLRLFLREGANVVRLDLREWTPDGVLEKVPPDWTVTLSDKVGVGFMGYSAHPPRVVERDRVNPWALDPDAGIPVFGDGADVTGVLTGRIAHANPYTGGRFWRLDVKVTPPPSGILGVQVSLLCPCAEPFEPIHPDTAVVVPQAIWVARVTRPRTFKDRD